MKFIFSVIRKKKGKVFTNGNILEMLTLLTIIFEWVSEKIAEDKDIPHTTVEEPEAGCA